MFQMNKMTIVLSYANLPQTLFLYFLNNSSISLSLKSESEDKDRFVVAYLIGDICEHDNEVNVALENHLPEVADRLRQRTLTGDVETLLVADGRRNVTSIDVSCFVILKN